MPEPLNWVGGGSVRLVMNISSGLGALWIKAGITGS